MPLRKHESNPPPAIEEDQRGRDGMELVAQLDDPDPSVRRWAARDLVRYPDSISVLIYHLTQEQNLSVREVMLTTLVRLNNPVAVACLVGFLRTEDVALRNEAVEALREYPDFVAEIIPELLLDKSPDVRIFGVNVLESLRHPDVEKWLIQVIENDPQMNVCATAVDVLAEVGTQRSRQALERLKSRFPDVAYLEFAIDVATRRIDAVQ